MPLTRRQFAASTVATGLVAGATSANAHSKLPKDFLPTLVTLNESLPAGEIHVVPDTYRLYWTMPGGQALRYTVGVGRDELYHPGMFFVGAKKRWPSWTPTPAMIKRDPKSYAKFADGMPGGIDNPLGARALYLFTKKKGDTFLRIHGTNDPNTIGKSVSNGCARLVNNQIEELYDLVPKNTHVVLYEKFIGSPITELTVAG